MKLGRNNKIIILLFALAIIIVPLSIHFIYVPEDQASTQSEWTAGELLGYCGAIIGAAATIFAIIITINFTMENQKEARKLSIKPYMQTMHKPVYDVLENTYESINVIYVTYATPPLASFNLPYVLRNNARNAVDATARVIYSNTFFRENHYILYEITNVGANNAVNINFKINDQPVIPPFVISINAKKSFLIRLKSDQLVDNSLELVFRIEFSDIASISTYEQHETIMFVKDPADQTLTTTQQIDELLTKPQEIPEER